MKAYLRHLWGAVVMLIVLGALPAYSQQSRNAVYFELGGSAVVPSINYEHRLNENWYGRAGLSWVRSASDGTNATTYIVPLTASWVTRPASNHHLELGGGVTIAAGDRQDLYGDVGSGGKFSTLLATGIIGYRYQKPQGGFQFRAAFTPVVGSGVAAPWAGISFGYAW
ncbi:MAG TPA: hypothetical protein VGJ82_10455 [Thermoanaerobaculia bacterium]